MSNCESSVKRKLLLRVFGEAGEKRLRKTLRHEPGPSASGPAWPIYSSRIQNLKKKRKGRGGLTQIKKADKEGALSASLNRIGSLIIPDILRLKVHKKE